MFERKKQMAQMDLVLEEVTKDTKNKIKELSFSYEKLGQILKKMPVSRWNLDEEEIENILGRISMETCQDCSNFYECYNKNQNKLIREVTVMLRLMEQHGTQTPQSFPESFTSRCIRQKEFLAAMVQSYEIMSIHKIWRNKMFYQRKAMASQMEEMSRILFGCSIMLGYDKTKEEKTERRFRKLMRREKIQTGPIRFYENAARKQEVFLMASSRRDNYPVQKMADLLSQTLRKNMIPSKDCRLSVYQKNTLLHFEEDRNYYVLSGNAAVPKVGNETSGDIFSVLKLNQGRQICILADGMGSGEKAREESCYVVELMEQFLEAGFREEETARLANSMLTFGVERNMYSSFDLFSFQLYTGLMKIIKSGSAATFIIRNNQVEILNSQTPPSGFLWEVEFDVLYKKLYDGDKILFVSDGVTDHVGGDCPEQVLAEVLPQLCDKNPQQAAEAVLAWALDYNQNDPEDDMSVMTAYIWKKKHPY